MDEDIFIPLIIFTFILLLVKMILDHAKWKRSNGDGKKPKKLAERSMSLSELEDVFQQTLDSTIAPIEARMARVEKSLRRLSTPEPPRQLSEPDRAELSGSEDDEDQF